MRADPAAVARSGRRGEEALPGGEVAGGGGTGRAGGGGTRRVEREEMEREETDMWGPLTELVLPSNPDSQFPQLNM